MQRCNGTCMYSLDVYLSAHLCKCTCAAYMKLTRACMPSYTPVRVQRSTPYMYVCVRGCLYSYISYSIQILHFDIIQAIHPILIDFGGYILIDIPLLSALHWEMSVGFSPNIMGLLQTHSQGKTRTRTPSLQSAAPVCVIHVRRCIGKCTGHSLDGCQTQ